MRQELTTSDEETLEELMSDGMTLEEALDFMEEEPDEDINYNR